MRHAVEIGHDEVDARPQHRAQPAEAFHHMLLGLRHDPHPEQHTDDDEGGNGKSHGIGAEEIGEWRERIHLHISARGFTRTMPPQGKLAKPVAGRRHALAPRPALM